MKVRIIMEITGDDDEEIGREIIADMTKITTGAGDLGLSLAEGKALLAGLQQKMLETQVDLWLRENREREGRRLRHKGYYPVTVDFHQELTRDWSEPLGLDRHELKTDTLDGP